VLFGWLRVVNNSAKPIAAPIWRATSWPTKLAIAGLCLALLWSYADALAGLMNRWMTDPSYGHGFFVAPVAVFLLWHRRSMYRPPFQGSWWGLVGFAVAIMMKLVSHYWYYALLDPFSLIPMAAGLCVLLLGWRGLRWCWPSILFLGFMVPLPGFVADQLSHPLQRVATIASVFLVQLAGIPAVAEGNVIVLTHAKIGVIEACNGLRMLILFAAVASAVAVLVNRPFWFRCLLLASAIPVALAANVIRITATAVAHEYASAELADWLFHDLAAWLMMPLGILLLWLELVYLDRAFPLSERRRPIAVA
jgi:exosortase